MITAFLLNLLLCSLGEDKEAPSAAVDGGTPVIVVHASLGGLPGSYLIWKQTPFRCCCSTAALNCAQTNGGHAASAERCDVRTEALRGATQRRIKPCGMLEDGFEEVELKWAPEPSALN